MKFLLTLPLAAAMLFAQANQPAQQPSRKSGQADAGGGKTYTGVIVDANCKEASALSSIASSSTDPTARSSSSKTKAADQARRDVLRRCAPTSTTTSFAILTDDGNFMKLDENGNTQVKNNKLNGKNTKVTATGTASGEMLIIEVINKM